MKALLGAFNQETALVGAFSVIVQPVVEPMDHYTALVKVVHLVRDPRAMITSIAKRPGTWGEALRNASYQCRRMEEDSKLEADLPPDRSLLELSKGFRKFSQWPERPCPFKVLLLVVCEADLEIMMLFVR